MTEPLIFPKQRAFKASGYSQGRFYTIATTPKGWECGETPIRTGELLLGTNNGLFHLVHGIQVNDGAPGFTIEPVSVKIELHNATE